MRIIFFGSSQFSVPALSALVASRHTISCVVTQPDRKGGRRLALCATPVKALAQEVRLKLYQPEQVNAPEAVSFLKALCPDIFIVVAFGQILSPEVLGIPKIFAVNAHASLLPRYRGAAPINWALINGEKTTGVTIIKMAKKMDAGPIILQKDIEILQEDTAHSLENKLSCIAPPLLLDALVRLENKNYQLIPQDERVVSFAPKLKKDDGLIDWSKPAQSIFNLVRGCFGWPSAFTHYKGSLLKIQSAEVIMPSLAQVHKPGEVVEINKDGISVSTGRGFLRIKELQMESKRAMRVDEFIAGHKICAGEMFE